MSLDSDEQYKKDYQKMVRLCEDFLHPSQWKFKQTVGVINRYPIVVYDSEWCRVQLVWGGRDLYAGETMSIYYGRLHAPTDKAVITWNGEECYCWHRVNEALDFLDGYSPKQAVDRFHVHGQWPMVMEQFRQSDIGKSLERNQPEWLVRMHANIWSYYGQRLFELFDLRRPDLWERFRAFLKEFHNLKGSRLNMNPPQYQRC